jgi:hypothetical protein
MVNSADLVEGYLRLLEVDQRLLLPVQTHLQIYVTASDVLHCWAVPSLGIKLDACPGRLNQVSTYIKREGVFYGQCSEICGVNHGFMPIVIEGVSMKDFVYRRFSSAVYGCLLDDEGFSGTILNSFFENPFYYMKLYDNSKFKVINLLSDQEIFFNLSTLKDQKFLVELGVRNN